MAVSPRSTVAVVGGGRGGEERKDGGEKEEKNMTGDEGRKADGRIPT